MITLQDDCFRMYEAADGLRAGAVGSFLQRGFILSRRAHFESMLFAQAGRLP